MQYIKYTYVDRITGVPVTNAPAANGPVPPAVAGLEYAWARESRYPTAVPEFFGTCPDDSDTAVPGVLQTLAAEDWETMRQDEMDARYPNTLEAIRDRALDAMRTAREPMLNAVMGIMTVAMADGDTATMAKAKEVRQALLDITLDPAFNAATSYDEMELAAKAAYRRVALLVAAHPQFAAVFREVTGA